MNTETGLEQQFFDIDTPIANGRAVEALLLGGVGPLSPSPALKPDAKLAALLAAQELCVVGLRANAADSAESDGGAATPDWIAGIGADIVSLAETEGGDFPQARFETPALATIGAGKTEAEAFRPVVRNIDGVRVGVLAFSERHANGFDGQADILHPMAYDRVRMLQAQCDHVIVLCHAGLPGANLPLPEWRERYRRFVDAGASIVVGMPPGGVSGWEEYRHGLVFYGLGTLAGGRENADGRSLALLLSLERNGRFHYEAHLLERAGDVLRLSEDETAKQSVNEINALFLDEKAYRTRCTALCRETYDAWVRDGAAHAPGLGRGLINALRPQSAQNAKRGAEARLKALLENESLRLAVRRALAAREAEEHGGRA